MIMTVLFIIVTVLLVISAITNRVMYLFMQIDRDTLSSYRTENEALILQSREDQQKLRVATTTLNTIKEALPENED